MQKASVASITYDAFSRHEAGVPRILLVADIPQEIRDQYPYAVTTLLSYRARDNGLPLAGEFDRISALEGKIIHALRQSGYLHAGHITGNGNSRVVFYGPENGPALVEVKTGLLSKTKVELAYRHDPNWEIFRHELEPTEFEFETCRSRPLMTKLKEVGDNHATVRTVDFAAKFASNEA